MHVDRELYRVGYVVSSLRGDCFPLHINFWSITSKLLTAYHLSNSYLFSIMSILNVLTNGGVQLLHSFPSYSNPIPLNLQVLEVKNRSTNPVWIDIIVSDGYHYCTLTFAQQMHSLVSPNKLQQGSLVVLEICTRQPLIPNKSVTICLNVSVVGQNLEVIGTPADQCIHRIVNLVHL
jgi:hypothetical protein